ncbi:MAG TPA: UdgX family uracil-DNA binding protein [Croceibacterium sp.]|nr:UdgX family uracil-DNA binding protein [Croceibacterium sp.]
MSAPFRDSRLPGAFVVAMPEPADFEFWRDRARALVQADVPPDRVAFVEPGGSGSLFGPKRASGDRRLPSPPRSGRIVRASRQFVELAKAAICHSDAARFDLLYRLLWRLQDNARLLEDRADPDVRKLEDLARAVRRDIHKMRAFVRFREVEEAGGEKHYVAWFEPQHHILRVSAGFFMHRFANMKWSILTPLGSLHWDGEALAEGPSAQRSDAPAGDPAEELWRKYYASIFNPARLKVGAMLKEMPRRYWKNMPEAALIPELVAGAQAREAAMVETGKGHNEERPHSLSDIGKAIHECRRCPIGLLENQAVMGEGLKTATLMVVGEQPGDQEDLAGKPFVGPSGQLLDRYLVEAGIDRGQVYVTNAVKHFKFVWRGKRRLHQPPTAKEIDTCRFWLEGELEIVKPRVVLALGASAARGLLGKTVSISKARGHPHELPDGRELWITAHPSYLLRLKDEPKVEQERLFRADLAAVAERLAELAE